MSLIDILLTRANLNSYISQLKMWNDKKPNDKVQEMITGLEEALDNFDWLEKAYIKQKELTATHKTLSDLKVLELENKIKELENKIKNIGEGL